ncbi:MAG: hypothetical protein Q9200_002572 [Gallowayella weberi]
MATQPSKPPLTHFLSDVIIQLKTPATDEVFHVHKALLCHHSPVFRAMLEHDWMEKQDGIIVLKEEDHETFRRFILWLYCGTVIDQDEDLSTIPFRKLIDCYFLADRRDVTAMQNYIIDTVIRKSRAEKTFFCSLQRQIWKNTPQQSLLRKYMVDILVFKGDISKLLKDENEKDKYDKSFIVDVLMTKLKNPNLISWDELYKRRCSYHIHNERVPPCSA